MTYLVRTQTATFNRSKSASGGLDCGRRWVAEPFVTSLQAALADLAKWLESGRISGMVIGGVAASVLGRPRLTRDIDALAILPETDWASAIDRAAAYGIVKWVREFAAATSMPDMLDEFDKLLTQGRPKQ